MAKRWESAVPCGYRLRDAWQYVSATTLLILSAVTRHGALRSTAAVGTILLLGASAAVETEAGLASTGHGGGNPGVGSWAAASDSDSDRDEPKRAGFDDVGYAEILARVPKRDLAAYQALHRALEFHDRGEIDAAISQYRAAINMTNDLASAWLNLGLALAMLDREDEAIDAYKVVIKLPNALPIEVASAYCNHGHLVQTRAGEDYALVAEGISLFQRGLERVPDHSTCLYNFGLGMEKLGRYPEAKNLYTRAVGLDPPMGNAHLNLGNIAFRQANWTEGILCYERAHQSPNADQRLLTISSFMLGQLHRHGIGNVRKAVEYYKRSYETDNTYKDALCAILQSLRSLCLWEGWESLEPRVASAIMDQVSSGKEPGPQSPYETRLTGELKPSEHLGLARLASQQFDRVERLPLPEDHTRNLSFRRGEALGQGRGLQQDSISFDEWLRRQGIETGNRSGEEAGPRRGARAKRRAVTGGGLVVAYWSYDYRDHAMGHLTRGLLCSHKAHNRVFAVAASYGPDDGSPVRRSAEACAGKFLDVSLAGHAESAKAVAAERPEIFVDLMGHTTGARPGIPALKPAPVVASYLGFPGTVGAEYTDYTIADRTTVPPELANVGFSEKMVYLPHSYQVNNYNVSYGFCPGGEGLEECQASVRQDFGPKSRGLDGFLDPWGGRGPVLCNYNTIHKMEPESFTVFMNIIKRVPGSVLLLLGSARDPEDGVEVNLKAEAAAMGVHPDRIRLDELLTLQEHVWRVSGSCDLFVDSFVYGAHTTAADALWAGLPLLTLRGFGVDDTPAGQMSGRVGTSLLSALGLDELSFHSVKDLENAAVALVQSPGRLATLRKSLLSRAMNRPLFDTRLTTRNLERAYEAMWEQRELGLPPSHIVVDPTQGALPPLRLPFDENDDSLPSGSSRGAPWNRGINDAGDQMTTAAKGMVARAVEAAMVWVETGTTEGFEDALTATGRLLAGNPLSAQALHMRGVALHFLGRSTEGVVFMERAALLATSGKHKEPGLDVAMLWRNLDAAQHAIAEGDGLSFPPETTNAPFLKGLAVSPSRLPTPMLIVLRRYWRRGDHTACADAFWKHWPGLRGHLPGGAVESAGERRENDLSQGGDAERGFGDGWAWEAWHGEDADEAAGILEAAASCFVGLGRLEEAWRAWKLASETQPGNQEFPLRFAACLSSAGHVERAHRELNRAVRALNHAWFHAEGGAVVPRLPRPRRGADGG
ncbi:unnamed protein product, partial [Ectocarpus sp. 4 AP-2014]